MKRKKIKLVRVVTASYVVEWHLHNTLVRAKDDFDICVVGKNVSMYKNIYPGIDWIDIDMDRKISFLKDISAFFKLCIFLHKAKPDILHSIMPKAGFFSALAGFLCGVPVRLHTFTGQIWATPNLRFGFLFYYADRLINLLNTACLTDSPSQSQFLFENRIANLGRPLPVLGNGSLSGVDIASSVDAHQIEKLKHTLGIGHNDVVFVFLARKTREKGAFDIINAFSVLSNRHRHIKLLFLGPDESGDELEKFLKSRPELLNNVICMGKIEKHEHYLAISDVLCLPSYREGFGTIVIDAAALSVPAIGSNIVGLVDAIEDGVTGILFPPGDIARLVSAMELLLNNPDLRNVMGLAAKSRVENCFSADFIYRKQKEFYYDLCR